MLDLNRKIEQDLKNLKQAQAYRSLKKDTKGKKDFCSNDYLGLAKDSKVLKDFYDKLQREFPPTASSASRLIMGNHDWHFRLEERLKDWFSSEAVLIFSSGYAANRGLLSCLKDAVIYSDALNHASIIDGVKASKLPYSVFRHNDVEHLEDLLKRSHSSSSTPVIVTESIFSMDGDKAPLKELNEISKKWAALLVVDEAHATGIYGMRGEGFARELRATNPNVISVHTWGKALGSYGASLACPEYIKEHLVNHSRDFIFTTALPPFLLLHWETVLDYLWKEENFPLLSKELQKNIKFFRSIMKDFSPLGDPTSPIAPILFSHRGEMLELSHHLEAMGFAIASIRSPSVALDQERIRITVHRDQEEKDMEDLREVFLEFRKRKSI